MADTPKGKSSILYEELWGPQLQTVLISLTQLFAPHRLTDCFLILLYTSIPWRITTMYDPTRTARLRMCPQGHLLERLPTWTYLKSIALTPPWIRFSLSPCVLLLLTCMQFCKDFYRERTRGTRSRICNDYYMLYRTGVTLSIFFLFHFVFLFFMTLFIRTVMLGVSGYLNLDWRSKRSCMNVKG